MGQRLDLLRTRVHKTAVAVSVPAYRAALRRGTLAAIEHTPLLRGLPVDTVLDVGANRGQFSVLAAHLFPAATIIAFEPLAGPASDYRRVLGSRAMLHELAVGASSGTTVVFETKADDSSSLRRPTEAQLELSSGSEIVAEHVVRVARLDELVRRAAGGSTLLKIDVQGGEYEVLLGAEELLAARVRHVYVEASFVELYRGQRLVGDVVRLLSQHGFDLRAIANPTRGAAGIAQADLLFGRAER